MSSEICNECGRIMVRICEHCHPWTARQGGDADAPIQGGDSAPVVVLPLPTPENKQDNPAMIAGPDAAVEALAMSEGAAADVLHEGGDCVVCGCHHLPAGGACHMCVAAALAARTPTPCVRASRNATLADAPVS